MKRKLESMEDLLQAVEYYGFLPFFPNANCKFKLDTQR